MVLCGGNTVTQLLQPTQAYSACIKSISTMDAGIEIYGQICNCQE